MFRQVFGRIRGALKRIPRDVKDEYRAFYFRSDVAQSKIVVLLLAIVVALFGFSDYPFLGFSLTFYILEALRFGVVIYSVFLIFHMNRLKDYRSYDRSLFVFLFVFVAFSLFVNSTRLSSFDVHAVIVSISIFVFYLGIPTRFANQVVLSLLYTAGEVTLMVLVMQVWLAPGIFIELFSLFFANVIAVVGSWQLHSYRWRIFQDFTEHKKSERLVVIGQTAGMVGHDIRNPLQAIVSELYFARQSLAEAPESEYNQGTLESLGIIQEQVDYISKIVTDLQDYARTLQPNLVEVDICPLIPEILKTVTLPDNTQAVTICEENMPLLKLDLLFMRRILTNLVANAIQAMPNGGKLTLQVSKKDNQAVITVADTGVGIPDEVKPSLFTPLFTTKSKGQGFGLVVVKRLVEAQDGTITFESQEGEGTTFIITFPL